MDNFKAHAIKKRQFGWCISQWKHYVFGRGEWGEEPNSIFNNNKKYNSKDNEWTSAPSRPSSRHHIALGAVGNQIYVLVEGPEAHVTVSATNHIFHSGRDDQKMTSGSKLINMKEMILVFYNLLSIISIIPIAAQS